MAKSSKPTPSTLENEATSKGAMADISQVFSQLLDYLEKRQSSLGEADVIQQDEMKSRLDQTLAHRRPVSAAFPPCTDVLLALAREKEQDKVWEFFEDYFAYEQHKIYRRDPANTQQWVSPDLYCKDEWPSASLTAPCITLKGKRHFYCRKSNDHTEVEQCPRRHMHRLFIADLVWLYYMDNIGLAQIKSKIIESYASTGELPISNGSLIPQSKDDVVVLVLEAMTRQMEMGTASKVRDRNAAYRVALGWESEQGKALNQSSVINTSFGTHFHKFVQLASDYYRDTRLATAIRGNTTSSVTVATVITIRDTLKLLQQSFENFDYGRVYHTTLSGIVWTISTIGLVRDLRNTIGIPEVYDTPDEYIPFAYRKLVSQEASTRGEINRFEVNYNCASYARDIILDIEALNLDTSDQSKEIETWLAIIEEKVEGYRTAYRTLNGVDLASTQITLIPEPARKQIAR